MNTLTNYLHEIDKTFAAGNATEHTHRPALKNLLESLQTGIVATNEPKRIKCGAPDFILTRGQTPLGYVEAKDIGKALDAIESDEQLKRYRESLGNLILTDYLEFRWYVGGAHRLTARLATVVGKKIVPIADGTTLTAELLRSFVEATTPTVSSPRELAGRMAHLARLICDIISRALSDEEATGSLHQQMEGFRKTLLHDLTDAQFADMYAQTIAYGLFAARCNTQDGAHFTRYLAPHLLPKTNPFLRKTFGYIAGPDLDERIVWAVDDLADLLARADMEAILTDFGKRTKQEDPVVHFYETFLAAYDPRMREARGVYYTPEPVVSYLVRSVDHLLKKEFNLPQGLADSSKVKIGTGKKATEVHRVQILDPATGTATFPYSIINHIYGGFANNRGMWSGYVREHLLPRLTGFELLMAPYAVAHLKLGLLLASTGYDFESNERLRVFLTNTLDEADEYAGMNLFAQWLADEANAASLAKTDTPVMVVIGNPPYSVSSQNRGDWIAALIEDYKYGLKEKKLNLDDDFIKFIRFAQWRIEQTGYGILAYISNNSYIDGITHRRMRESLMETFDDIYILDLHGNSNKKERAPNGTEDKNVFDIKQGVAIGIFVKRKGAHHGCTVRHAEMWGTRESKYNRLMAQGIENTPWKTLEDVERASCLGTFRFFTPKAFDNIDEYCDGYSISNIFLVNQNAIKTDRDSLFFDFTRNALTSRMETFYSQEGLEEPFRSQYGVANSSGYDLMTRRERTKFNQDNIHSCLYRPFDSRNLYYATGLTSRAAWDVMRHMIGGSNIGLIATRQTSDQWDALATNTLCGHKSCAAYDINSLFPLYLYPTGTKADLFDEQSAGERRANLAPAFVQEFAGRLGLRFVPDGKGDLITTFGPEDVFSYMYAVFHSTTYRSRYAEFLKIDFPRLPLTSNVALFRDLCGLGGCLVGLHLLEISGSAMPTYPEDGTNIVEAIRYTQPSAETPGRVWINKTQYFERVTPEVWEFHVGGYQVCAKWLKDRKGRTLAYDDLMHYQRICAALAKTAQQMTAIDMVIEESGGFPLS